MSTSHTRSIGFSRWFGLTVPALLVAVCTMPAFGQPQPPQDNGNNQQRQGRFDPSRFQQMMIDRLKEALGATDEEMQVLTPKLEKVIQLQRDASAGGMRALFGRGGQGGPQGGQGGQSPSDQQLSAVQQKAKDLKDALDAKAPASDIKAKMQALRDARTAAKAELAKAQSDLKELLTQKQEAVLLMVGMLE